MMSGPTPAFDLHVIVDWSAAGRPTRGRDSIWALARSVTDHGQRALADASIQDEPVNLSTRHDAERWLAEIVSLRVRLLIGIDVPLGVPAGLVDRVEIASPAPDASSPRWQRWWSLVGRLLEDGDDNANNRWWVGAELNRRIAADAGPFWGCPPAVAESDLAPTRPTMDDVVEWRHVEGVLRDRGLRPFSVYQLAYAGSVGSQALTAVVRLDSLCATARAARCEVAVWPFEPVGTDGCSVTIAEIWPSAFDLDLAVHPIRDAAQVIGVADRTVAADRAGRLGPWMADGWMQTPDGVVLDESVIAAVRDEEGWVLGIRADGHVSARFV